MFFTAGPCLLLFNCPKNPIISSQVSWTVFVYFCFWCSTSSTRHTHISSKLPGGTVSWFWVLYIGGVWCALESASMVDIKRCYLYSRHILSSGHNMFWVRSTCSLRALKWFSFFAKYSSDKTFLSLCQSNQSGYWYVSMRSCAIG